MHTANILVDVIDKELKKKKTLMLPADNDTDVKDDAEDEVFQQEEAGRMKDPKIVAIEKVAKDGVTDEDYHRIANKDWVVEEEPLEPDEKEDKNDLNEPEEPGEKENEDPAYKKLRNKK